jgi:hypothetical protein
MHLVAGCRLIFGNLAGQCAEEERVIAKCPKQWEQLIAGTAPFPGDESTPEREPRSVEMSLKFKVGSALSTAKTYSPVIVVGEIRRGIEKVRPTEPVFASQLELWLRRLQLDYQNGECLVVRALEKRLLRADAKIARVGERALGMRSAICGYAEALTKNNLVHKADF